MATVNELASNQIPETKVNTTSPLKTTAVPLFPDQTPLYANVTTTVYDFPTMKPLRFSYFPDNHLYLPLRKDILHRAIIYEGDKTRAGTASTKWRDDVHGSHRKLYPQKGTGKARVGDKQSPIRRGGGAAFGPKPRDFATKLPRKVYDLAWRTALSFRYRRGELVVVDKIQNPRTSASYWLKQIFERNGWGNAHGRSLLVAQEVRKDNSALFQGLMRTGTEGKILTVADVDVKNLLEMGRVVIEEDALRTILKDRSSDLVKSIQVIDNSLEFEEGSLMDMAAMEQALADLAEQEASMGSAPITDATAV